MSELKGFSYPDGGGCKSHKTFMGYGLEDLEKIEDEPFSQTKTIQKIDSSWAEQYYVNHQILKHGLIGDSLPNDCLINPQINEPQAQKENNQMSVIKMIKAKFSPVDKILVKHGYLTDKGERTSMYEQELKDAAIADLIEAQDTKTFRQELSEALSNED